jgi:hypothetical protein
MLAKSLSNNYGYYLLQNLMKMLLLNSVDRWRKESQMSNFVMPLSEALGMSSVQVWKENNGLTSRD